MKYGIVTCGLEPNYGACLQAYATQILLDKLKVDNELINYSFLKERSYSPLKQPNIKAAISSMLFYRLRKKTHDAFQEFRHEFMRYSKSKVTNVSEFNSIIKNYSGLLIGSDQVWNPFLGIDIDITLLTFYLSQNGPRKVSYASSFGIDHIPPYLFKKYSDSLDDFDRISVREEEGKLLVSDLIGRDVPVVMDPCALLTYKEWEKIEDDALSPFTPYVFVYDMRHDSSLFDYAISIGKRLGCQVVAVSRVVIPRKEINTLCGVSPAHFISLVKNARYIITDSFHGTLFSIIFRKDFNTFCTKDGQSISSRISTILSKLALTNRLIDDTRLEESERISDPIDFSRVEVLFTRWRDFSWNYLKNCFNESI